MSWNIIKSGVACPEFREEVESDFNTNISHMGIEEEAKVLTGVRDSVLAQVDLFMQSTKPHALSVMSSGHAGRHTLPNGDINVYGQHETKVSDLGEFFTMPTLASESDNQEPAEAEA